MKKILDIFVIVIILLPTFIVPDITHAKTLGDLKNELKRKQDEYSASEQKKQLTEQQIQKTNQDIVDIRNSIKQTAVDINNLQADIDALYTRIADKKAEVKKIVNFVQKSSGVSSYLEYIFGAKSFTDLIYRAAVAEQMSAYNEKLVKEYNELIEQNKNKQTELASKQVKLGEDQKSLEEKVKSLGQELEEEKSTGLSIAEEIKSQKEIIEMYQSRGCKDNEDIKSCGRSLLPAGTAFYRPTDYGRVTSEFGYRALLSGWHEGLDVGVSTGTKVYSVGIGLVADVYYKKSCGGNMVVIHHKINNKTYTSVYAHLSSINVQKGEMVTKNSVVGYSGGGASTQAYNPCTKQYGPGWDTCSCAEHLHLTVAEGQYGIDYTNWSYQLNKVYARDPRSLINFPSGSRAWNDRLSAY